MKKCFITLLPVLFSTVLWSQVLIYEDELIKPGLAIIEAIDYAPDTNLMPGGSGANMQWFFLTLEEDETDSVVFAYPDSTPYAHFFPQSDMAVFYPADSFYVYLEKTSEKLSVKGFFMEVDTFGTFPVQIEPEELLAVLPMFYENEWASTSVVDFRFEIPILFIDSARYKITTELTASVDAWGELFIPGDTFNTLRVHENRLITDSVWVKYAVYGWRLVDSLVNQRLEESYVWWSDKYEAGYSVCTMKMSQLTGTVESVSFLKRYPYLFQNEISLHERLISFPNPAGNEIIINFGQERSGWVEVFSENGIKVLNQGFYNQQHLKIETTDFPGGIYIYRLYSTDGQWVSTGKFIKSSNSL